MAATATSVVTLAQVDLPRDFWKQQPEVLYWCVFLLWVATLLEGARFLRLTMSFKKFRRYELDLRAVMSVGLVSLIETVGADERVENRFRGVGVHAFRKRGPWPFDQLVNIAGIRLGATPNMEQSRWRPGRGVIGRAVQTKNPTLVDWEKVLPSEDCTKEQWEQDSGDRYGLSWETLNLTREYQRIAALPVVSADGKVIGGVAVTTPWGSDILEEHKPQVFRVLHELARGVRQVGKPPLLWLSTRQP